jgi:hypothetical protein
MAWFGYRITREPSRGNIEATVVTIISAAVGHPLANDDWDKTLIAIHRDATVTPLQVAQKILDNLRNHDVYGTLFRVIPVGAETIAAFAENKLINVANYIIQTALRGSEYPSTVVA